MNTDQAPSAADRGSELSDGLGPAPELDVLAELRAAAARKWAGDPAAQRAGLFSRAAAEIEDLRRDLDENAALRERMADLLRRTAVALRGPEPPLTRWSWHDLPERAAAAVAEERERLARDVAGLHMAQSVNNQNHPSAWHDGVDAALEVIRGS